jgi:outer membrane protein assembly factor BamB
MNKKINKILSITLLMVFLLPLNNVLAAPAYNQSAGTYTDDFTNNSGVPTRNYVNVNTVSGILQLTNATTQTSFITPYKTSGYVITSEITPTNIAEWGNITFNAVTSASTTLKIQVCDSGGYVFSDNDLPGNSTGFTSSPIDISAIPLTTVADIVNSTGKIARLKLKITMTTTDTNYTPTLDNLVISWTRTQGDLSAQPLANSLWPTTTINSQGTSHSQYKNTSTYPTFKWAKTFSTSTVSQYNLMYNNDLIFLNWTDNYTLFSLDRDTGDTNWSRVFLASGSPAISQNGTFYEYEISNDTLVALDVTNGSIKWTYNISSGGHGSNSAVIGNDGSIYFVWGSTDNTTLTIYAINPDGSLKWTSPLNPSIYVDNANQLSVALDGTLYLSTRSTNSGVDMGFGKLYALNATTGLEIWHYDVGDVNNNRSKSGVIDNDGTIYLGNYSSSVGAKKLYAIDSNGNLKWEKDYSNTSDFGYIDYVLRGDGILLCTRMSSAYTHTLEAINTNDGSVAWTESFDSGYPEFFTDSDNGLYFYNYGTSGSDSLEYINYYDSNNNLKWQIPYTYSSSDGVNYVYYNLADDKIIDDRGWLYGTFGKTYYDESWSHIPANEYLKYFAMAPWTLSVNRNSVYYYPGDTITFTATSSMLSTNPLFSGDNQVQVVMDNNEKIPLTFSSINGYGDSVWTGSYVLPLDTSDGIHTFTVEASQPYVKTDITTHFASASTNSNNTGVTSTNTFIVDTAPVITLTGSNPQTIALGASPELRATANDAIDGSVPVITSGSVNNMVLGTYTITYTATDSIDNIATSTRIVNVVYSGGGTQTGLSSTVISTPIPTLTPTPATVSTPTPTPTPTIIDPQSILNSLLQQLASLQQQLANQQTKYQFTHGLQYGDTGEDVAQLQTFLKAQGADIYPEGLITGYFGNLTKLAVQRFQLKYNIAKAGDSGYGYVGPKTRAKINSL